jgi:hypothetical protein
MRIHRRGLGFRWIVAPLCLVAWAPLGCGTVGPASISRGRVDYNEAIRKTDAEQTLVAIVHNRYGETSNMLAVTSVTANMSVSANAGIQLGFGDEDNYAGNLVPFGAGVAYEENPTITYAPVHGQQYMRQLMAPIPLDVLVLFARSAVYSGPFFRLLVRSVNDIRNLGFLPSASVEPDPRFARIAQLTMGLRETGLLDIVKGPQRESGFSIVIRGYAPAHIGEARELLGLLRLSAPVDTSRPIVLPLSLAVEGAEAGGVAITTRSVYDLIEILSASIEVPEEHRKSGLTTAYPALGLAGREVRIRHSKAKPGNASVAVKYRGLWFYIDETDQPTKFAFRLLSALWSTSIADTAVKPSSAPVLTVPVSR